MPAIAHCSRKSSERGARHGGAGRGGHSHRPRILSRLPTEIDITFFAIIDNHALLLLLLLLLEWRRAGCRPSAWRQRNSCSRVHTMRQRIPALVASAKASATDAASHRPSGPRLDQLTVSSEFMMVDLISLYVLPLQVKTVISFLKNAVFV